MNFKKLPSQPSRVLIADDEHLMASGMAASLRSIGFDVAGQAADGEAACELAAHTAPDIAVLDIRMPRMDGLMAAKRLWDQFLIPSIIVSAYSDEEYVRQAEETGVYGYLLKPVSADALRVAISVGWARAVGELAKQGRIAQLEQTLVDRRIVEQAKWRLVEQSGMSESEAHAKLQKAARSTRRKLVDVANDVLSGTQLAE